MIERNIFKINKDFKILSYDEILKTKRPLLDRMFCDITDSEKIKNLLINKEKKKLKWLEFYGSIETDYCPPDKLKLELVLNEISRRSGKKNNFFTQKLDMFDTRYNKNQRKEITLLLLRVLI